MKRERQGKRGKTSHSRGNSGVEPHLSPRLRRTPERLLPGESAKEVSRALDIRRHTVHEYVCGLYRHFGVNTRAELPARWFRGQGR